MVGLSRDELLDLIPKFVMNATNSKSVPLFYRKLLFGQHIETREYLMSSKELLIQLHHCKPANIREQSHLLQNIDQVSFIRISGPRNFNEFWSLNLLVLNSTSLLNIKTPSSKH